MTSHPPAWEGLTEFPPYYVRILARSAPRQGMSDAEIAIASGLDINRIREIKFMESYGEMQLKEITAYFAACDFNPTELADRERIRKYEYQCNKRQSVPFHYLRKHPKWESEILPVVKLLKSRLPSNTPSRSLAA